MSSLHTLHPIPTAMDDVVMKIILSVGKQSSTLTYLQPGDHGLGLARRRTRQGHGRVLFDGSGTNVS